MAEQGPCKPTPTEATKPKRRSPPICPLSSCVLLLVNPNSDLQDHEEDPQARLYFASEARHHQDQEGRDSSCQWTLHRTCHCQERDREGRRDRRGEPADEIAVYRGAVNGTNFLCCGVRSIRSRLRYVWFGFGSPRIRRVVVSSDPSLNTPRGYWEPWCIGDDLPLIRDMVSRDTALGSGCGHAGSGRARVDVWPGQAGGLSRTAKHSFA